MKHIPIINFVISGVQIPKTEFENIVNYRLRNEKCKLPTGNLATSLLLRDFEPITTNSTHATVKGSVQIKFFNGKQGFVSENKIPIKASFLVTCIKNKSSRYEIGICSSLS